MRRHTSVVAVVLFVSSFFAAGAQAQITWYVDDDAPLGGDGTSWPTAYRYLQDALAAATGGDEIRVAAGTYTPDRGESGTVTPGDRTATFWLITAVSVRGGYAGLAHGVDPNQRDVKIYKTILSGDLGSDDELEDLETFVACFTGPGGPATFLCTEFDFDGDGDVDGDDLLVLVATSFHDENSYHVVTGDGTAGTAVLDGFTITAGNADAGSIPHNAGGGMRTHFGSPTLIDCTFTGNSANFGGGMENYNGACPTLIGCTFVANASTYRGGGMHNNTSHPILVDCTFTMNVAVNSGGGIRNWDGSYPDLIRCALLGNSASFGGGMVNDESNPILNECIFSGNSAEGTSGGMHNWHSDPTLINCTFTGNTAGTAGGAMYNASSDCHPVLANCILWANIDQGGATESAQIHGGGPLVGHTCIQGLDSFVGNGNIGLNPLLADADGEDSVPGTEDDNVRLLSGSPCIDAGDNAMVLPDAADLDNDGDMTERTPLDADDAPRFVDDPDTDDTGVPDPPDYMLIVDMGAYEYADCNENGVSDGQDIAQGTSQDCNENAIPDECDVVDGTSEDCDADGTPDECETDTDGDEVIDDCDDDDDNDCVLDGGDNAPLDPHSCEDVDADTCDDCSVGVDGFGSQCDNDPASDGPDADVDGHCDAGDNCDFDSNPEQEDTDGDMVGNVCDNCPDNYNADQANSDNDTHGDACDNCPEIDNEDQADADGDGFPPWNWCAAGIEDTAEGHGGNVCDECPSEPCHRDLNHNGLNDCAEPDFIPAVSEWGLIIMTLLLLTGMKIKFGASPRVVR